MLWPRNMKRDNALGLVLVCTALNSVLCEIMGVILSALEQFYRLGMQ